MKLICNTLPLFLATFAFAQDKTGVDSAMADAMAKHAALTTPGPNHHLLERFIGSWSTETVLMMGGKRTPAAQGKAEYTWLFPGRWIKGDWDMPIMGMSFKGVSIMGYDNFKMSYVATSVTTMDTAMNSSEGDLDPSGKALILYGTVDEYLTGEHDKMSKTVFRFVNDDKMIMEVHDFAIGENHTQVVEVTFTRTAS